MTVQTIGGGRATIDAGERGSVVTTSGTITLRDITLSGGLAEQGGGIYLQYGSLIGERLIVTRNETTASGFSSPGGGIWARGDVTLTDSEVSVNRGYWIGGGIYGQDATITLDNTDVFGNYLSTISGVTPFTFGGGGIYLERSSLFLENGTDVRNNLATGQLGGGIAANNSDATCTNSGIRNNGWAGSTIPSLSDYTVGKGGVFLWYNADFMADNCNMGTVGGADENYGFDVAGFNFDRQNYGTSTTATCFAGNGSSIGGCTP